MIMGYYRVGAFADIMKSVGRLLEGLRNNICYDIASNWGEVEMYPDRPGGKLDGFGVPGAALRGLFEYIYHAGSLEIIPHMPQDVEYYEQLQPVRFGDKKVYMIVEGSGSSVTEAWCEDRKLNIDDRGAFEINYSDISNQAAVRIVRR